MTTPTTTITGYDLMDSAEVAEALGIARSSLAVAMSQPDQYRALADRLPAPLRKVGTSYVWLRADVEAAIEQAGR